MIYAIFKNNNGEGEMGGICLTPFSSNDPTDIVLEMDKTELDNLLPDWETDSVFNRLKIKEILVEEDKNGRPIIIQHGQDAWPEARQLVRNDVILKVTM